MKAVRILIVTSTLPLLWIGIPELWADPTGHMPPAAVTNAPADPTAQTAQTANDAQLTRINVTLLGQTCLLQGPVEEGTLKAIHALGPAQLYPNLVLSEPKSAKNQIKHALSKLQSGSAPQLPSQMALLLKPYREKLINRLEAQLAFLEAAELVNKSHDPQPLQNLEAKFFKKPDTRSFEAALKKLKGPIKGPNHYQEIMDQIFDTYNDEIEPDPENAFHKAIEKVEIQYRCQSE